MPEQVLRLFVSSPGDVQDERRRVELVVERLNAEFEGRARIEPIRWEKSYYSAHDTFQRQIPEAAECDLVIAVFRARLGIPLPAQFPQMPNGEPYPSGTAYEVLSAIESRRTGKPLPDIYVFRYPNAPSVALDAPDRAEIEAQWVKLKSFFDTWFRNEKGEFIAAFQQYVSTDEFAEKLEDCLRQWLARRGFAAQGPVWDRLTKGSPFPGLSAFEADRGTVFFGRDLAVVQSVERLREAAAGGGRLPFLLIIGASGAGKSSLLRAGLLPRLVLPGTIPEIDLWRTAIVVPGPDPFLSLAESLFAEKALGAELIQGSFRTKELLARQLAGDPETAVAPLRGALEAAAERRSREAQFGSQRPARLALAIDQAERLFIEAAPGMEARFAALLSELLRTKLAFVVLVLRSDAYARFQANETLVALREAGASFDLVPPGAAELEEIVTRPVAACRPPLAFEQMEGRSLAARLVADAKGGDALPLLQMTLRRLYTAEAGRGDGLLRLADYRGMDVAVTETANEALDGLTEEVRAELPALITGLVADVGADPISGSPTPVIAALERASFEAVSPARKALVSAFVTKRLLTAEGDGHSERVRPTHEALLRIWPQAVAVVAEAGNLIRVRHTLEPIVREWSEAQETDRPRHLDISPALLGGAELLATRFGADLPAPMRDFIAASSAAAQARALREREEQERRLRDAQALAAANRRIAQRTGIGLAIALVLAALAGWEWRTAQTERDRAARTLALATATANGLVFDLAQKFKDVVGVPAATIKSILDRARELQDQLQGAGEASPDLRRSEAGALTETADMFLALGDTKSALAAATRARDILQALAAQSPDNHEFERDLAVAHYKIGSVLVEAGNLTDALAAFRASLAISERLTKIDAANSVWQRDLSLCHGRIGDVLMAQGKLPYALASYQASLAIYERLASLDPGDASWQRDLAFADSKIGDALVAQGNLPEALKFYEAGLGIAEHLAKADPGNAAWQRNLLVAHNNLGNLFVRQGKLGEALESYEAGRTITLRLTTADPGNAVWQRDLSASDNAIGDVLIERGDLPGALASYSAGLAIIERLAKADQGNARWQRDLGLAYNNVARVQVAQGKLAEALKSYAAGLKIIERLANYDPGNAQWRRDLSIWNDNIGDVLVAEGKLEDALKSFSTGLAIIERLANSDPGNAEWQRDLSISYDKVGFVLSSQNNLAQALKSFEASLAIKERLAKSDPGNVQWQGDLSVAYARAGDALVAQGNLPEALKSFSAGLAIRERLNASQPGNGRWQRDQSVLCDKVGEVLVAQGNLSEALEFFSKGLAIMERLTKSDPGNAEWQRDLSVSYQRVGQVLAEQNKLSEALDAYRASLAIVERLLRSDPDNAERQRDAEVATNRVGDMLALQDKVSEALESYEATLVIAEKLAKSYPGNALWQRDLVVADNKVGILLIAQGKPEEALAHYSAGLAIVERLAKSDPGNAGWQRDLSISYSRVGDALAALDRLIEAQKSYEAGLAIAERLAKSDPSNAQWRKDLDLIVGKIGDHAFHLVVARNFAEALQTSDLAIADEPQEIWLYSNRAHALMLLGRLDEAREVYLKYRGQTTMDGKVWETVIRDDFAELRKAGLTSPLMDEIAALFRTGP